MYRVVALSILNVALLISPAFGAGQEMMRSRVPEDKLEQARALTYPNLRISSRKGKPFMKGKGRVSIVMGCGGMVMGPAR